MFSATFKLSCTCRTTVIFGTLQNSFLEINSLALLKRNCFTYRNIQRMYGETLDFQCHHSNGSKRISLLGKYFLDCTIIFVDTFWNPLSLRHAIKSCRFLYTVDESSMFKLCLLSIVHYKKNERSDCVKLINRNEEHK